MLVRGRSPGSRSGLRLAFAFLGERLNSNIDQIGWDGKPHVYPPIQIVELDDFDFDEYERLRVTLDDDTWGHLDASTLRLSDREAGE